MHDHVGFVPFVWVPLCICDKTHFQPVVGCPAVSHQPLLPYSGNLKTKLQQGKEKEKELEGGKKKHEELLANEMI